MDDLTFVDDLEFKTDLHKGWYKFLRRYRWTTEVTITYGYPRSEEGVFDDVRRFARRLARIAGNPVPYFVGLEYTCEGWLHAHMLLRGVRHLSENRIKTVWNSTKHRAEVKHRGPDEMAGPLVDPSRFERNTRQLQRTIAEHEIRGWVRYVPKEAHEGRWEFSDGFEKAHRKLDRLERADDGLGAA